MATNKKSPAADAAERDRYWYGTGYNQDMEPNPYEAPTFI
jgi:hypothetical protein